MISLGGFKIQKTQLFFALFFTFFKAFFVRKEAPTWLAFFEKNHFSSFQMPQDGKKRHTTPAQRNDMVAWLQDPENFALISGTAARGKKVVAGQKLKKVDGYKALSDFINQKHRLGWDAATAKSRYESYLAIYKVYYTLYQLKPIGNSKEVRGDRVWSGRRRIVKRDDR